MSSPRNAALRSLRTQIALVFGALVILLALLLSLGFGEMLSHHLQRRASETLNAVARNAATLLAEGLLDRSREVEVLARSETLWKQGIDTPEVSELLARNQAMRPSSLWIGVADTDGMVRTATGGLLVGQTVKDRPWFTGGMQGLFVGDVHHAKLLASLLPAPASGEPLRFVDFAAPVQLRGRTVAVLGVHGSWDWVRQVIEGLLSPSAYERELQLFIFDQHGDPIYAPGGGTDALRGTGQKLPLAPVHGDPGARPPLAQVVTWKDGRDYLTASVRMEPRNAASDLDWTIVAREPAHIALAPVRQAQALAAVAGLVTSLLACGVAWFAARSLSVDLYRVAQAAAKVERGEAGASMPEVRSSLEVHALSTSLQRMTRRLVSAHADMEAQVHERTRELEAANRELDRQVRRDPLTGVLNRRGFQSQCDLALALARRGPRPLALLMVDADHFKRVNDSFGHDVGDEVLKFLAATMTERLRSSDVVARMGGEEFVALLPDTDLEAARKVAQSLIDHVAAHRHDKVGQVTISVGLAVLGGEGDDAQALLRRADEALYDAKHQGRNRVVARA